MYAVNVMVLGIGCTLYSDEGFGVRVVEKMQRLYEFPDNVLFVDGGVLGVNLLGVISQPEHLIVVDTVRNKGNPGDLYRLEGEAIPERIPAASQGAPSADSASGGAKSQSRDRASGIEAPST